ncbi:MAG: hypothetical protein JXR34_03655 [Bacteroidales bacterium]|nr:hypothetical protein [Bacteroidales bacterium]
MENWKAVIDQMQLIEKPSLPTRLELLDYQYGYIAYCLGKEKEDEAEKYLEKAWDNLEILEDKKYQPAWTNGYRSAFYGYEIGLSSMMAPFYGPKSMTYAKKAMEADANNPFGFIQYGNIQYYMPSTFGGSKTEAIEYYKKAIVKMEALGDIHFNWNYLSLLAVTGQALESVNKLSEAKLYYEKALKKEPNFLWVKNDLLPKLLKKLNNGK